MDKAADVTVTHPTAVPYGAVGEVAALPGGSVRTLASCEFFTAQLLRVETALGVGCADSFTSLLLLEGAARLLPDGGGEPLELTKGASVFLPAG